MDGDRIAITFDRIANIFDRIANIFDRIANIFAIFLTKKKSINNAQNNYCILSGINYMSRCSLLK